MFVVKNLSYKTDHITIFKNLSFSINDNEKIAIIGNNGVGKSILLKLLIGEIKPDFGEIIGSNNIAYFPQKFNSLNFNTVADVFNLEKEVIALSHIENGIGTLEDYENLNDNWRCIDYINKKMDFFNIKFDLTRKFDTLSGGEKVKLILSSIVDEDRDCLIFDEPTNNMDCESEEFFYKFIKNWKKTLILVSHDRELLNLVNKIAEIRRFNGDEVGRKIFFYGGNFDYYLEQKEIESENLQKDFQNSQKAVKQLKSELQSKTDEINKKKRRGEKVFIENCKAPKVAAKAIISSADAKVNKSVKESKNKIDSLILEKQKIQEKFESSNSIYFNFGKNDFSNKILLEINDLNFSYDENRNVINNFSILLHSGDRIAIDGKNGCGKTTLLKIINGKIKNYIGEVRINTGKIAYLDQEYNFLDNDKTILENIMKYSNMKEKDCRDILAKFLFRTDSVHKKVKNLSGGEKTRVALAMIFSKEPELILLDEPTNNMDLDSIKVLEDILKQYSGGLIVVSHDNRFKKNINIREFLKL